MAPVIGDKKKRRKKVGSGAEVPAAKAVAWLGALSTSPSARPEAAGTAVAVAALAAAAAAEGKRRVAFSAPVPPSKRGWATSGSRAIGGGDGGSGGDGGGGGGGGGGG